MLNLHRLRSSRFLKTLHTPSINHQTLTIRQTLRYVGYDCATVSFYARRSVKYLSCTIVFYLLFQSTPDKCAEGNSAKPCLIVEEEKILRKFRKCDDPDCNAAVDSENIEVIRNGSYLKVRATCNNSHVEIWESSNVVGTGHSQFPVINLLIVRNVLNCFAVSKMFSLQASYTLLCGLNIGQVSRKSSKIYFKCDNFRLLSCLLI